MVVSYIKAKRVQVVEGNRFFGTRKFIDESVNRIEHEKFDADVAPSGLRFSFTDNGKTAIEVEFNKYDLTSHDDDYYTTYFSFGKNTYEVNVWFDENGKVKDIEVEFWNYFSDYESGMDADKTFMDNIKYEQIDL